MAYYRCSRVLFLLTIFNIFSISAYAEYPNRYIKIINPIPSGSSDLVCRIVGKKLSERVNQQVVIENVPGAHGNIAKQSLLNSAGDGYTLLFVPGNLFTVNPFFYKEDIDYRNFVPIVAIGKISNVMVVPSSLNISTIEKFNEYARNNNVNYASSGIGSSLHISALMYEKIFNIKMQHIPYVSPMQAMIDTVANRIQVIFHLIPVVQQNIENGKLTGLMILDSKKSSSLPKIPTSYDLGYNELQSYAWYFLMAPKDTPKTIINKLYNEVNLILRDEGFLNTAKKIGLNVLGGDDQFIDYMIVEETKKYKNLLSNISK